MDKLPIPEDNVVALDTIAPHVTGVNIIMVNVYAVSSIEGGWSLIDAGLPLSATRIKHFAENRFGAGSRPQNIILTHGHFDHVGALKELVDYWQVPVYAHRAELPYITGQSAYPPPDASVGGGLMTILSPMYPRGPIDIGASAHALPDDGSVPGLPGWQWIHTPGHTPGHVSFFRKGDSTLLVGDAFCTTKAESFLAIASQPAELHGPPAYYTPDWDATRTSIEKLAALRPMVLAPGHGYPMVGPEVADALQMLATDFDRIVLPDKFRHPRPASH